MIRDGSYIPKELKHVPIVYEYSDVPKELASLPPDREIEFGIELLPDTWQISIPSYQTTLAKLKELKDQLQDLLEKMFYSPQLLSLGCTNFVC